MGRTTAICFLLVLLGAAVLARAAEAEQIIGTKPPEWQLEHWLNSRSLKLPDLRGQVVLIRWWTAPDCHYCQASAPALNEFHHAYRQKGLRVIGVYHHKSSTPLEVKSVARHANRLGFKFPVAIDTDWRTLKRWWLDQGDMGWTSVTFLLDRQGVIRHLHPGGQYVKGDKAYAALTAKIEELLAEK
jgi:peroxiredoxin